MMKILQQLVLPVFAATRMAATTRRRRDAKVQTGSICISHGDKLAEKKP
jgi:hypothetical protein